MLGAGNGTRASLFPRLFAVSSYLALHLLHLFPLRHYLLVSYVDLCLRFLLVGVCNKAQAVEG